MKKLLFLLSFLLLISCGKKEERVELSLLFWGSPEEIRIVEAMKKEFEIENPEISLKLIHSNRYLDKLQIMIGGGTPPDVFYMGIENFPAYVSGGSLMNLEPFLQEDTIWNPGEYFPELLTGFRYRDNLYGIPKDWSPLVLYYNKDLFDRAGISYPDEKWTWENFLDATVKITKDEDKDGKPDIFGFWNFSNWVWTFPWIWSNGGSVLSEDRKTCLMDSPEVIEALQFLYDLTYKYKVAPTSAQTAQRDLFTTGKVGMVMYGRWMVPRYRTIMDFKWGVAPLPKKKERVTPLFTVAFVVSSQCKHPKEAYKLVRFFSGKGGNNVIGKLGLAVPSMVDIANSPVFLSPEELPENSEVFLETMNYARLQPVTPQWEEMGNIVNQHLEELFLDKKTPSETAKDITQDINELLVN
ncbi:sugar ABC transporter substrate-binding protein [candidate division WOR-3 bacterium]|nr:sugar ABC transporter substrate-binding protein [candidate division WOR-3 bacterium]